MPRSSATSPAGYHLKRQVFDDMVSEAALSDRAVRERFARARRNGYAAWLWPDTRVEDWRAAVEAIADAVCRVLAGEKYPVLQFTDANAMGIAGYTSGMGPLLGWWIESGIVGADRAIADCFAIHLSHNRLRAERFSRVAREITGNLTAAGISPLILKGMHTGFRYFPEPAARPMSDIDLFIPMESMGEAQRIFSRLGYRPVLRTRSPYACDWSLPSQPRRPRTLTFVHEDDPWSIDVLGSLDRRLPTGQRLKFANVLPCAEASDWCPGAHVMREPLLALYLATHLSQTLLNVTVLRVLEFVLVIRRDGGEGTFDWNAFLRGAALIGGARFVYPALAFARQLAPDTISGEIMAEVASDVPKSLGRAIEPLTVASAQPLRRHSLSERFMWAGTGRERLRQIASEIFVDGQGRPGSERLHRIGSKLWALGRGRYSR